MVIRWQNLHTHIYIPAFTLSPEALHKTPPSTETCVTSSHDNRRRTPRGFSQPFRKVSNQQQPTVHTHTSAATTGPRSMTVTSPGTHPSTGTPHPGYSAELHPTPSSSIALYLCARVCVTCMPLLLPYTWLARRRRVHCHSSEPIQNQNQVKRSKRQPVRFGLAVKRYQHTREFISARRTSLKHNNKDLSSLR